MSLPSLTALELEQQRINNDINIAELAKILASGAPVVFLTGAGLSVSSGITPYRYTSSAIWSNFVVE